MRGVVWALPRTAFAEQSLSRLLLPDPSLLLLSLPAPPHHADVRHDPHPPPSRPLADSLCERSDFEGNSLVTGSIPAEIASCTALTEM